MRRSSGRRSNLPHSAACCRMNCRKFAHCLSPGGIDSLGDVQAYALASQPEAATKFARLETRPAYARPDGPPRSPPGVRRRCGDAFPGYVPGIRLHARRGRLGRKLRMVRESRSRAGPVRAVAHARPAGERRSSGATGASDHGRASAVLSGARVQGVQGLAAYQIFNG
jgi:hypothetical protein